MRVSSEQERAAIKTAWRLLRLRLGSLEHIACEVTRLSAGCLSKAGDDDDPYFAPIDAVYDLEKAAGKPMVTEALALMQGYTLRPLQRGGPLHLVRESVQALATLAGFAADAEMAMRDGRLSARECAALRSKISDLVQQLTSVHDRLTEQLMEA